MLGQCASNNLHLIFAFLPAVATVIEFAALHQYAFRQPHTLEIDFVHSFTCSYSKIELLHSHPEIDLIHSIHMHPRIRIRFQSV